MISVFVKANGELQRYATDLTIDNLQEQYEGLCGSVIGALPLDTDMAKISPILVLIEKDEELKYA